MSVATTIILDTRRIKENRKYPLKLRVNFRRVTNYYQTVYDLSQEDYDKLSATRISAELQEIKTNLRKIQRDAENEVKELGEFSFLEFERRYITNNKLFAQRRKKLQPAIESTDGFDFASFHKKFPILLEKECQPGTITWSYKEYIKKLLQEGRISTAVNYHCSYVSIKKYGGNVSFSAITPTFLASYEQRMKSDGLSKSTIGIYLRPLRAVYNEAVEAGLAKKDKSYPFGKRRYQIPAARNVKKALDLNDVEQIYYFPDEKLSESEQRSKAYWLFSYFGNGMNPKDIACLKYSNIHGDYIIFERAKTERSQREDPKPITVYLNEDMRAIIKRWGNMPAIPNEYIFPILQHGISPLRQYTLIQNVVSVINDCMQRILDDLKIAKKATTYVARHTFSTVLKKSGATTEHIQEALGHSNKRTTENYLDSFDNETKKQLAEQLTSFKKNKELVIEE